MFIFTESASRRCSEDGLWYDYDGTESEGVGWTNFTSCFSQELWDKLEEQANKTGKFLFIILSQLDALIFDNTKKTQYPIILIFV